MNSFSNFHSSNVFKQLVIIFGKNGEWCVQMAGALSTRAYDSHLLGNSSFMGNNCKANYEVVASYRDLSVRQGHTDSFSVAHLRPRISKGIADLLLNHVQIEAACSSKKNCVQIDNKKYARQRLKTIACWPLGYRGTHSEQAGVIRINQSNHSID